MDRFAEPPITDAAWAPLHAFLVAQLPVAWANTQPSDVPVELARLGQASVLANQQPDEESPVRQEVEATVRLLSASIRHAQVDQELWPALRAIGHLAIGHPYLERNLMMLGTERDGRTAVELAHAFARMGAWMNGVAAHLLHMHLAARSPDALVSISRVVASFAVSPQ